MRVHVLLCDHAVVAEGKLFIQGAGISQIGPHAPTGLAVLIYVPWDRTNEVIKYRLDLVNEDGMTDLPTRDGSVTQIEFSGQVEAGRPSGIKAGTPIELCIAHNFPPLAFLPAGRYQWILALDEESAEDWSATFDLRS